MAQEQYNISFQKLPGVICIIQTFMQLNRCEIDSDLFWFEVCGYSDNYCEQVAGDSPTALYSSKQKMRFQERDLIKKN